MRKLNTQLKINKYTPISRKLAIIDSLTSVLRLAFSLFYLVIKSCFTKNLMAVAK